MLQSLLKGWIDRHLEEKKPELSALQIRTLYDFVGWADSRSPTLRAPERSEQRFSKAPECPGCGRYYNALMTKIDCKCGFSGELGEWHYIEFGWKWSEANTKISKRSDVR